MERPGRSTSASGKAFIAIITDVHETTHTGRAPFRKLSERAWVALGEALRTFHWYRGDFETLLRARFSDAPGALAAVNFEGTKRQATGQLIAALRSGEQKYQGLIIDALVALSEVDPDFPHLARLDDGEDKVREARTALATVRKVTEQYSELATARESILREAERARERESARRLHDEKLAGLRDRFLAMHGSSSDPQQRGLDWWATALGPKEVNDFKVKVDGKARNTLGLCVSVAGFTDGAIAKHSQPQTPLILMDGNDLMPILEGRIRLDEALGRKRRHAAETGNAMYRVMP